MKRIILLCTIFFCSSYNLAVNLIQESQNLIRAAQIKHEKADLSFNKKKDWTILLYFAADNNLGYYAVRNILQLLRVGSTKYCNIVVELDIRTKQGKKVTFRYFIKNKTLVLLNENQQQAPMDSGRPETLINFCTFAMQRFPAHHYMLCLWSHGTGTLDPSYVNGKHMFELFTFNQGNKMYELDRTIPFMEYVTRPEYDDISGICFDESTKHYLTNEDLCKALDAVYKGPLKNKKIDIVAFDACLMGMLELADILKPYAQYMIASQEVELALSYDYYAILKPFEQRSFDVKTLAQWMITTFEKSYQKMTNDYTLSAVDLAQIQKVEESVAKIASILIQGMSHKDGGNIKDVIKASRHKFLCTYFSEPSYIDLHHFLTNVLHNIDRFRLKNKTFEKKFKKELKNTLHVSLAAIKKAVIGNAVGQRLQKAQGISIYFPTHGIHRSYVNNAFGRTYSWLVFIKTFLTS